VKVLLSLLTLAFRMVPLLLILTMLSRVETDESLAEFLFALSVLSIAATFIEFGHINSVVVRYNATRSTLVWVVLAEKAINLLPFFLAALLAGMTAGTSIGPWLMLAAYFFLFHVQNVLLILIRLEDGFGKEAWFGFLANALFLAAFFVLWPSLDVFLAMMLARFVSFVPLAMSPLWKYLQKARAPSADDILTGYKVSFFFFLTQAFGVVLLNIDTLSLKPVLPQADFVVYALANRYYMPLTMISLALSPSLLALLASPASPGSGTLHRKLAGYGVFLVVFSVSVWAFFDDILGLMLPKYRDQLAVVHNGYSLVVFLRILAITLNVALLADPSRWAKTIPIIAAILVFLAYVAIVRPGTLSGALTGIMTSYFTMLVASALLIWRRARHLRTGSG